MFLSLVSGSSGNCSLVSNGNTTILIDAGISSKNLECLLSEIGISPDSLNALVITHEHFDHIKGAGVVSKKYSLPVFATKETLSSPKCSDIPEENKNFILPGNEFEIGMIKIKPFSIPHDAANPVGYTFSFGCQKLSLATDIGEMNDNILNNIKGSIAVILESNHDTSMLSSGPYPYILKKRISGKLGHLSNESAAKTALELVKSGTKHIMLAHLSKENNTPKKAIDETADYLFKNGFVAGKDFSLRVASPFFPTDFKCEVLK